MYQLKRLRIHQNHRKPPRYLHILLFRPLLNQSHSKSLLFIIVFFCCFALNHKGPLSATFQLATRTYGFFYVSLWGCHLHSRNVWLLTRSLWQSPSLYLERGLGDSEEGAPRLFSERKYAILSFWGF